MTPDTPAGGAVATVHATSEITGPLLAWTADGLKLPRGTPIYTQPPATVSADAVLALVGRWRAEVERGTGYLNDESDRAVLSCADELEALTRGEK